MNKAKFAWHWLSFGGRLPWALVGMLRASNQLDLIVMFSIADWYSFTHTLAAYAK